MIEETHIKTSSMRVRWIYNNVGNFIHTNTYTTAIERQENKFGKERKEKQISETDHIKKINKNLCEIYLMIEMCWKQINDFEMMIFMLRSIKDIYKRVKLNFNFKYIFHINKSGLHAYIHNSMVEWRMNKKWIVKSIFIPLKLKRDEWMNDRIQTFSEYKKEHELFLKLSFLFAFMRWILLLPAFLLFLIISRDFLFIHIMELRDSSEINESLIRILIFSRWNEFIRCKLIQAEAKLNILSKNSILFP